MKIGLPGHIDREKWRLRLGTDDYEGLSPMLERAEAELFRSAEPRGVYKLTDIEDIPGEAIKKHLAGCRKMVLMAVTLGAGVDRAIRAAGAGDAAMQVFLDTGASVLADDLCGAFSDMIRDELPEDLPFMTGRYSPGYGDLPLEYQDRLTALLDTQRKIGLTVTESHLMLPRKSVTAIIGVSDHEVSGYRAVCSECALRDKCELRKQGRTCG
ncbi:MAG: vitamin B12 dependent-methionine synthase activation domain-containing protein [Anaerovoracaceae bacterium]|nr:vitamin B12 dependent-methionine synthase activation domain-containing protein [Anaerovoracaceae bacterium]